MDQITSAAQFSVVLRCIAHKNNGLYNAKLFNMIKEHQGRSIQRDGYKNELVHFKAERAKKENSSDDPILTMGKVVELLDAPKECIRDWSISGVLPYSVHHGYFYYRLSDVAKLVRSRFKEGGVL